jgi:Na+/H+ antiporter NhaC
LQTLKNLAPDKRHTIASAKPTKTMNYNIATILAVIAILFVLLTYITGAPLVPVAVILLGLAIIFGGSTFRRV